MNTYTALINPYRLASSTPCSPLQGGDYRMDCRMLVLYGHTHHTTPSTATVDGAPVYCGADAIQPNSTYSLSVRSVMNSALTRTVLATGTFSRGHLSERFKLPALSPGIYKIAITGTHHFGYRLVLPNHITVNANRGIVSVSAESQQPFLNQLQPTLTLNFVGLRVFKADWFTERFVTVYGFSGRESPSSNSSST